MSPGGTSACHGNQLSTHAHFSQISDLQRCNALRKIDSLIECVSVGRMGSCCKELVNPQGLGSHIPGPFRPVPVNKPSKIWIIVPMFTSREDENTRREADGLGLEFVAGI